MKQKGRKSSGTPWRVGIHTAWSDAVRFADRPRIFLPHANLAETLVRQAQHPIGDDVLRHEEVVAAPDALWHTNHLLQHHQTEERIALALDRPPIDNVLAPRKGSSTGGL